MNTFVFKRVLFSQPLYVVSALVKPTLIPIPYRIYQPKRAGNLPIPANPPVNEWDATLQIRNIFSERGEKIKKKPISLPEMSVVDIVITTRRNEFVMFVLGTTNMLE